jgi:hypothetical protein
MVVKQKMSLIHMYAHHCTYRIVASSNTGYQFGNQLLVKRSQVHKDRKSPL